MPDELKNLRQAKRAVRKGMTPDEAGAKGLGYGEDYDKLLKSRAYKKQRASEAGYKNVRQARKAAKANDGFLPNSPYMMYGKEAAPMMGGSPLAKYGCSKKYKKSGIKMKGEDKLEATILHDTDKGEQTKYKGKMVTIKGNTVTRGGNVVGYVGKDKKIKEN